jgi:hypothetical protein
LEPTDCADAVADIGVRHIEPPAMLLQPMLQQAQVIKTCSS